MSALKPKYKEVLDCVYLQGYSQSEAAKFLNIPLGTVKTRIRVGMNTLREVLNSEKALFLGSFAIVIILILSSCL